MTKLEATAILGGFKYNPLFNDQQIEAFDMAVSALSENKTQMIDKSNFDTEQYKADLQSAYDCGYNQALSENKGEWIEKEVFDGDTAYECSECGELFCLIDGTPTDNLYKFCPNCGCSMKGG